MMHSVSPYLHVVTDTELSRKVTSGGGDMKRTASLRDTQNAKNSVCIYKRKHARGHDDAGGAGDEAVILYFASVTHDENGLQELRHFKGSSMG